MRDDILKELYRYDEDLPDSMVGIMRREEQTLPDATVGTLGDIFRCGGDKPAYSRRLARAGREGPLTGGGNGEPTVNTYPFGVPCDRVFPEFVGVCAGRRSLESVLDRTLEQCELMSKALDPELPKTVTILTDKWHDPKFRKKYDLPLLRYALRYNIFITFWLVTDYGVTRVPFLVRRRDDLRALRDGGIPIELDPEIARSTLLDGRPCTYDAVPGPWRPYDFCRYKFDFAGRTCVCSRESRSEGIHERDVRRRIPADAMDRFAQAVQPVLELPEGQYVDKSLAVDAGSQEAVIFGKRFQWKLEGDMPYFKILAEAFRELITALK